MIWELRDSLGKKATEQAGVEGDWTAAFLYFGLMKNSCRACLLLYCFFGNKKEELIKAFLTYAFIPWLLNSFDLPWLGTVQHREKHTLTLLLFLEASGGGGGVLLVLPGVHVCACARACVFVCVCVCVWGGGVRWLNYFHKPHFGFAKYLTCVSPWLGGGKENL